MIESFNKLTGHIEETVSLPTDDSSVRLRKTALVIFLLFNVIVVFFSLVSELAEGRNTNGIIAGIFTVFGILIAVYIFRTKRFTPFFYMWLAWSLVLPVTIQILNGGFSLANIMPWGMIVPMSAAIFLDVRQTIFWYVAFVIMLISVALLDPFIIKFALPQHQLLLPSTVFNLSLVTAILVIVIRYLTIELEKERARAENLLLNILPAPIASRLKRSDETIADSYPEVTVLFADIVDFTRLSSNADPADVVNMLNLVFSDFDYLTERFGLEKIKTIGDAYMVAGGLPNPSENHCEMIVEFAFAMLDAVGKRGAWNGEPIKLRIGIHTGPVVAGVIGKRKFIYDLWGDTVNIASRMESNGMTNAIHVTEAVREKLKNQFNFEQREPIHIKGKGKIVSYLVQR